MVQRALKYVPDDQLIATPKCSSIEELRNHVNTRRHNKHVWLMFIKRKY